MSAKTITVKPFNPLCQLQPHYPMCICYSPHRRLSVSVDRGQSFLNTWSSFGILVGWGCRGGQVHSISSKYISRTHWEVGGCVPETSDEQSEIKGIQMRVIQARSHLLGARHIRWGNSHWSYQGWGCTQLARAQDREGGSIFLGFTGYYWRSVKGYASIVRPPNDLLIDHPTNKNAKNGKKLK